MAICIQYTWPAKVTEEYSNILQIGMEQRDSMVD